MTRIGMTRVTGIVTVRTAIGIDLRVTVTAAGTDPVTAGNADASPVGVKRMTEIIGLFLN